MAEPQRVTSIHGPRLVSVPDIVTLPLRKAMLLIQRAGLRAGAVLYQESYEEKDTVLSQDPPRGRMVYSDRPVTLWVSRESYIKWLPSLYQRSDATGKNFVRDLLWVIQHVFGSIEEQLDFLHLYFDSYEAPERFLPWLAAWSAMILEEDWPIAKKRRLIKEAMYLYRKRGTVKGLQLFVSLFTGFEPEIRENDWPFRGCRVGVTSAIGIDTVVLPPVDTAQSFLVVMPFEFGRGEATPEAIIRLQEIIELEKPANTQYMLKFADPLPGVEEREFYRIGIASGINVGQEIVTPLPISEDTGEPIYPKEVVEPKEPEDPSVYELFGTRRRELPELLDAPRADNAPVEGQEITSSKYGFEGAMALQIDEALMRDLLRESGAAPSDSSDSDDPARAMRLEYGDSRAGGGGAGRGPRVEVEYTGEDPPEGGAQSERSTTVRPEPSAGESKDLSPPVRSAAEDAADDEAARRQRLQYGDRRFGAGGPQIEVEVEQTVVDGDEQIELSPEALAEEAARAQAEEARHKDEGVGAVKDEEISTRGADAALAIKVDARAAVPIDPAAAKKDNPPGGGSGGSSGSK